MMASSKGLDERAQVGFAKSSAYDLYRPAYSSTIVQLILEQLRVAGQNGAKILDLAAGTGKFTEALAARDEKFQIIAVEPHDGMRQVLDDKKLLGVTVKAGTADAIPIEDGSVDAVICAQVGRLPLFLYQTARAISKASFQGQHLNISFYGVRAKQLVVLPLVCQYVIFERNPSRLKDSQHSRYGVEHRRLQQRPRLQAHQCLGGKSTQTHLDIRGRRSALPS